MTKPAITRLTGLEVDFNGTNSDNGLYVPQLTTAEIATNTPVQAGGIIFNTTTKTFNASTDGKTWAAFAGGGTGDVTGPGVATVVGDVVTFSNVGGTAITDSGIASKTLVIGTGASTGGNIPSFLNTTCTNISDSGIASTSLVLGPATSTATHIPVFNNAAGSLLSDSGMSITAEPALYFPTATAPTAPTVVDDGTIYVNTGRLLFESGTTIFTGTIPAFSTTTSTIGTATLAGGTKTVSTTAVTATSHIFLTNTTVGANTAPIAVTAQTAGVNFVVTSFDGADTNTFNWMIINAA